MAHIGRLRTTEDRTGRRLFCSSSTNMGRNLERFFSSNLDLNLEWFSVLVPASSGNLCGPVRNILGRNDNNPSRQIPVPFQLFLILIRPRTFPWLKLSIPWSEQLKCFKINILYLALTFTNSLIFVGEQICTTNDGFGWISSFELFPPIYREEVSRGRPMSLYKLWHIVYESYCITSVKPFKSKNGDKIGCSKSKSEKRLW